MILYKGSELINLPDATIIEREEIDRRRLDGWIEAPPQPPFDPATQILTWDSAQHIWIVAAKPIPPTPSEIADAEKTDGKAIYDATEPLGRVYRAIAETLLDELNILRGQVIGVNQLTWDPASMANATGVTSPNITVTGAAFGDVVDVAAPYTLSGIIATAYVSAANTIVIRLHNGTGAAVNLVSGNWQVFVRRVTNMPARTPAQARTSIQNKIDSQT